MRRYEKCYAINLLINFVCSYAIGICLDNDTKIPLIIIIAYIISIAMCGFMLYIDGLVNREERC